MVDSDVEEALATIESKMKEVEEGELKYFHSE